MHFKQKLAFFVFGCVFVIVGQVVTGLVVPSATAQGDAEDATFDRITARTIRLVDEDGTLGIFLQSSEDLNALALMGPTGAPRVYLSVSGQTAAAHVSGGEEDTDVTIMARSAAPASLFLARGGEEVVMVTSNAKGGLIGVLDRYGEPKSGLGVD